MTATPAKANPPAAPAAPSGKVAEAPKSNTRKAELCDIADCITKLASSMPHPGVVDSGVNAAKLHGYAKRLKEIAQSV